MFNPGSATGQQIRTVPQQLRSPQTVAAQERNDAALCLSRGKADRIAEPATDLLLFERCGMTLGELLVVLALEVVLALVR